MEKSLLCAFKLFIIGSCLGLASCDWAGDKFIATLSKPYKYNIIGITGPESAEPYVEVRYCKDDGQGNNVIVKEMLSPPILFGGHRVNILCDSFIGIVGHTYDQSKYKKIPGAYKVLLKHQYGEGGAEYLRIINHSADKSIEFFVAGSQDMEVGNTGCKGWGVINVMPRVYYKRCPIYYLLFPEKKYTQNLIAGDDCGNAEFYFEGNRCGDLELDQAWSVNKVMGLYRAEYRNDPETELYLDESSVIARGRLNKVIHSGVCGIRYKRFYGVIMPGETLSGGIDLPLLATPGICVDELINSKYVL